MNKLHFGTILDEFPCEFDGLKELAEELHMALFPIRDESLFTRNLSDAEKLYTPMIDAFDKAIVKFRAKRDKANLLITPISA